MSVSVRRDPAVLKRLVGDYLRTHGDAEAQRLDAYTKQNGVSDAEVKKEFDAFFEPAPAAPVALHAETVKPAQHAAASVYSETPQPRQQGNALLRDVGSLFGHMADLLNPVSSVGEAVFDAANDAALSSQRAAGTAWLKARGLDATAQANIVKLVSGAEYFHGTGRFQYANAGDSKYDGVTNNVADKLEQIISAGGLKPQYDAYYSSAAKDGASTSMASSHMYARYYAQLHQEQGNDLQYQYGTAGDWESMMGAHLAVSGLGEVVLGHALGSQPSVQSWARTVNRNPQFDGVVGGDQRSDIKGNYAVVFGMKRGTVQTVAFPSRMNRIEARTADLIPFSNMTHVEVPLRDVAATEKMLRDQGISLPVLAMEDVEAVLSRFSAAQLVNNTLR